MPFGHQRADDVFSTRGLLGRLRKRGVHSEDLSSAIQGARGNRTTLSETFASFGKDFGEFLEPFITQVHADALLITGGIDEAWEYFVPSLKRSLSIPVLRGTLGNRAALLGVAALFS